MLSHAQMLHGLLLPALVAAVLALIGWLLSKGRWSWGLSLGFAVAMGLAYKPLTGSWPKFPPADSTDWPLFATFGLALLALFERTFPRLLRPGFPIVASAILGWLLLRPLTRGTISQNELVAWTVGIAITAGLWWSSTEVLATVRPGPTAPLVLWLVSAGAGMLLLLCGNQKLGFLVSLLAAVWGLVLLLSIVFKKGSVAGGPLLIGVTLLVTLLAYGYFDPGAMSTNELILIGVAPLLAWVGEFPFIRKWKPLKRELVRLVFVLIPIGGAIALAVVQFKKDSEPM